MRVVVPEKVSLGQVVVGLVGGVAVLNLVLMVGMAWVGWRLAERVRVNSWEDLAGIEKRVEVLGRLHNVLAWTSLGAVKLPIIDDYYRLAGGAVGVAREGLDVAMVAQEVMILGKRERVEVLIGEVGQLNDERMVVDRAMERLGRGRLVGEKMSEDWRVVSELIEMGWRMSPHLDSLLGFDREKRYLVILQNNMELRPTGGFMGSYAEVVVGEGRVVNFGVEDIYTPDGQLEGYVREPEPIARYLHNNQTPGWRLRDANWHPDFAQAVVAIDWFFDKGKVGEVDGYVAINLIPVLELIGKMEPVVVPGLKIETITAANFYDFVQHSVEVGFFPGSTMKRDLLDSVGGEILRRIDADRGRWLPEIGRIGLKSLVEKQVLIFSFDGAIQATLEENNWAGRIGKHDCGEGCVGDYVMVVEANVGVNKANCCIEREFELDVSVVDGELKRRLGMRFVNENPVGLGMPYHFGGNYENYLRLVIPEEVVVDRVMVDGMVVEEEAILIEREEGKQFVGLAVMIEAGEQKEVVVEYGSEVGEGDYRLLWQKQAGIRQIPVVVEYREGLVGESFDGELWSEMKIVGKIVN